MDCFVIFFLLIACFILAFATRFFELPKALKMFRKMKFQSVIQLMLLVLGTLYTCASVADEIATRQAARFESGMRNLAAESPEIRIGGVYELIGLALEKKTTRDTVTEVLLARLRSRTLRYNQPVRIDFDSLSQSSPDYPIVLEKLILLSLQAGIERNQVDLSGLRLNWAKLAGLDLSRCNLAGVILADSDLRGCRFDGANLSTLVHRNDSLKTYMDDANLTGATFCGTKLNGVSFYRACLDSAIFYDPMLGGAIGLTLDQIASSRSAVGVILPPELDKEWKRRELSTSPQQ